MRIRDTLPPPHTQIWNHLHVLFQKDSEAQQNLKPYGV